MSHHHHQHQNPHDPLARLTDDFANVTITGAPATPDRHRHSTRSATHHAEQPPGAPTAHRQQHLVRDPAQLAIGGRSARDILLEHLAICEPNRKFSAQLNKVAKEEGYHHIGWRAELWKPTLSVLGSSLDKLFVDAVLGRGARHQRGDITNWGEVEYFPQKDKLLQLEGDVADSVLTNVLNPIVVILNRFIHPQWQDKLQIVIRSQHDAQGSKLDHALYLVEMHPEFGHDYRLQIPLVVIEEKAPGIVRESDWVVGDVHEWAKRLIPQLFLYAQRAEGLHHHAAWSRFFLTSYNGTVAVRIRMDQLRVAADALGQRIKPKNVVEVQVCSASHEYAKDSTVKYPCDYGFRVGVASEVFLALHELGVANMQLLSHELHSPDPHDSGIREDLRIFLRTYVPHPLPRSGSPSEGRHGTRYSTPPDSPR